MNALDEIAAMKMRLDKLNEQIKEKHEIEWKKFMTQSGLEKLWEEREELQQKLARIRQLVVNRWER